ncbi:MAG: ectoine/hydroxyectoine ABC transporter permease subunit EhuD [Geodermatophilaceae bacterium]|nr:ectoine/hydroxyectoine ABC transporter permease subunit EhuD [Geodermatophilaceae bacterium]MDQ3456244.1 ectoine/hydroxyectoine ABC transporter permease subunit EhuD [Actinomycetota bacterium]
MIWDWAYTWDILPELLRGLVVTVQATLVGSVVALVLGLVLALLRRSRLAVIRIVTGGFVEFVRSTPLLVQLYFLFFVLPSLGITLSGFQAGVIGLGVHYATYTSEVYRAGIEGVPRGQWEAATALNLPSSRVWRSVILPQAIPRVLPALGNYVIAMFKETPLLSAITVLEMLAAAKGIGNQTFRYLEPLTLVGLLFLLVSLPASFTVRRLERRFGH